MADSDVPVPQLKAAPPSPFDPVAPLPRQSVAEEYAAIAARAYGYDLAPGETVEMSLIFPHLTKEGEDFVLGRSKEVPPAAETPAADPPAPAPTHPKLPAEWQVVDGDRRDV